MAIRHLPLRDLVFDIWVSLFERDFSVIFTAKQTTLVILKYKESFLNHFVLLFHLGMELVILRYFSAKADSIDSLLIIYFVDKVLPDIEMPIPVEIYGLMLKSLKFAPAESIASSSSLTRLLEFGNHLDLDEEATVSHIQLQSLIA